MSTGQMPLFGTELIVRDAAGKRVCIICGDPHGAKGYCPKHYQRWKAHGDPLATVGKWTRRLAPLPRGRNSSPEELRQRQRSRVLLATYGINADEYDAMAEAQEHRCKCCGCRPAAPVSPRAPDIFLVVEHDHQTDAIRGLTCQKCNLTLGLVEAVGLEHIVAYLAAD